MLASQNFGRSHDGGLVSVRDRNEHGTQRDDGFTRADFAVDQTVHRKRLAHVGCDFLQDALLRFGELER